MFEVKLKLEISFIIRTIARCYLDLGDLMRAQESAQEASKLDPDSTCIDFNNNSYLFKASHYMLFKIFLQKGEEQKGRIA
jgi:hypothetical protein